MRAVLLEGRDDMDTMQRLEWLVGNAAPCGVTIQRFGGHVYCTVLPTNDISMPTGVGDTLAAAIEDCFIEAGGPEDSDEH